MTLSKLNRALLVAVAAATSIAATTTAATAATIGFFGLAENNTLLSFNLDNPANTQQVGISGVRGKLLGVDFRPANGKLYGITNTNRIYTIDTATGAATFESRLSPLRFRGGQKSGFDFNPAADRLRLEGSNDQNFRINVDTGEIADFDPATPGVQPDGTIAYLAGDVNAGENPNITAVGYTNSFLGAPAGRSTQLYGIDYVKDTLVLQNPANDGALATIGALGFDFDRKGGFDIFSPSAGNNTAYAASGGSLYTVDLASGAALSLGSIGSGNTRLVGLAATSVPEPATVLALCGLGAVLVGSRRRHEASGNSSDA